MSDEIEAAAKAILNLDYRGRTWERASDGLKRHMRDLARAALEAAERARRLARHDRRRT